MEGMGRVRVAREGGVLCGLKRARRTMKVWRKGQTKGRVKLIDVIVEVLTGALPCGAQGLEPSRFEWE